MIRMFQSQTSEQAKSYFREALDKADYYIEDQEMNGQYHGAVAKRLGLKGHVVDKATFNQLCDNINPLTGKNLTPRTVSDRRVGYDISFHCPKSVSILHALSAKKDQRVLHAFEDSVHETMLDLQVDMQTRIRTQGQYDDRDTGELLWTNFVHQTARPVDGQPPDPHLHCHCFTFNVTYDKVESRFKAGQFHNLKKDMPYYQARFHKRLADKLSGLGYGIRRTGTSFEVLTIPQKAIDHFSKRTNLIGQVAKEQGIINPKDLDQLGARTRSAKQKSLTMPQLKQAWRTQLKEAGIDEKTPSEQKTTIEGLTPKLSIDHALDHVFLRASVKRDRQILAEAYSHAVDNRNISMDMLDRTLADDDRVFKIKEGNQMLCTTSLVHEEEKRMVQLAVQGRGKLRPLKTGGYSDLEFEGLNSEQVHVINHVMSSQDRLTMIRGGAGTGKTTLLKTIIPEIEQSGRQVHLFAPTAEASRDVLQKEGFNNADTVQRLLIDKDKHVETKGQVIWVDEAGMLGASDMVQLLEIAEENQARLILSGDARQHTAVMRGDAMRILQTVARIPHASLNTIYRQKQDGYKEAVKAISEGQVTKGFQKLDQLESVIECKPDEVKNLLVKDYLQAIDDKKSALVVSPTNQQREAVALEIRDGLKTRGVVKKRDKVFTSYRNLYWTEAQKRDVRLYKPGLVIQTHQNLPGLKRGQTIPVLKVDQNQVYVGYDDIRKTVLPTLKAKDFDVYVAKELRLSKGDEIRLTKNGSSMNGKRLYNGNVLSVIGFNANQDIVAEKRSIGKISRVILDREHGNFDYAYAMTSYSAQSKTVDRVLIAQPSTTFPASDSKQFYVSVSRGRESVKIYTDDREDLLKAINKTGDRQGATELIDDRDMLDMVQRVREQGMDKDKQINKPYGEDPRI